jgi:hypothetical protein
MFSERKINFVQLGDGEFLVNGYPAPITVSDWRRHHLQSFPAFVSADEETGNGVIQEAIESVYTMFIGVMDFWSQHEPQTYFDKTRLCYRLLTCWWIADLNPEYAIGIMTTGGMPLANKKIGPITIGFNTKLLNGSDPLQMLLSNPFGVRAHGMIKNALVRMRYRGNPPHIIGRESEMGWFMRLIAMGAEGTILAPNNNSITEGV